ncbi:MAG TPA: hypothetical protein DDX98_08965 [Bacteroidales bacterium]|jgi:hypothetical protein|nr:hypothetical protein [Bacteroidales bacterium]
MIYYLIPRRKKNFGDFFLLWGFIKNYIETCFVRHENLFLSDIINVSVSQINKEEIIHLHEPSYL